MSRLLTKHEYIVVNIDGDAASGWFTDCDEVEKECRLLATQHPDSAFYVCKPILSVELKVTEIE